MIRTEPFVKELTRNRHKSADRRRLAPRTGICLSALPAGRPVERDEGAMPETARRGAPDAARDARASEASGRVFPLHPFLFAAASVLALLSANLTQTSFSDAAPALAGALAFALAVYLVAVAAAAAPRRRGGGDRQHLGVGCLYYVEALHAAQLLARTAASRWCATLPLALAAHVSPDDPRHPPAPAAGRRAHPAQRHRASSMFASPAWHVTRLRMAERRRPRHLRRRSRRGRECPRSPPPAPPGRDRPPDIYHFIFDRFASEDDPRAPIRHGAGRSGGS